MLTARNIFRLYFCTILAFQLSEANLSQRHEEDISFLLKNVNHIWTGGSLGWFSVFGPDAFPVVAAETSTSSRLYRTLVAGARYGAGRIIAGPHNSFLYSDTPPAPNDRDQLLLNIVNWLSPGQRAIKIATIGGLQESIYSIFRSQGIQVSVISFAEFANTSLISNYDAILTRHHIPKELVPNFIPYLESGRGLLISPTAWSYSCCRNGGHFGSEYPGNVLASKVGFVWSQRYGGAPNTPMSTYNTSREYLKYLHPSEVLRHLKDYTTGAVEDQDNSVERSQHTLWNLWDRVPATDVWADKSLYESIQDATNPLNQPVPTLTNRVSKREDKIKLQLFHICSLLIKPEDVKVHPASKYFPGEVIQPRRSRIRDPEVHTAVIEVKKFSPILFETADFVVSEEDLEDEIRLPEKNYRWFSTGLYAPAGQVITVNVNDDNLHRFSVQIGSHSDSIHNHKEFSRVPWVVWKMEARNNSIEMASPYGGLIYIIVHSGFNDRNTTVTIKGSVRAPVFQLGETSVEDWQKTIRYRSAPWTEFTNGQVTITVTTVDAAEIDDPREVMRLWSRIADAVSDLAGKDPSSFEERFVADVQISGGSLHSGYPIMSGYFGSGRTAINFTTIRDKGAWGHFHELGHNHQNGDWTFSGTGETTCNIFALFIYDTILGIPFGVPRWFLLPENYRSTIQSYIKGGRDFNFWKSHVDFSLLFYVQIQQNYGWEIYKSVFREYRKLGSSERPKSDQDKMDLWMIMLSKNIQKSLLEFFESWGFPISDKARNDLKQLGYSHANITLDDLLKN